MKYRKFKIAAIVCSLSLTQGCLALVPMAASGAMAYATNSAAESAINNNLDAQRMNCRELRARYLELSQNPLQKMNPFANQAVKAGQVRAIAQAKGCRMH